MKKDMLNELREYFEDFAKGQNLSDAGVKIASWGFECGWKAFDKACKKDLAKFAQKDPETFRGMVNEIEAFHKEKSGERE